MNGTVCKPLVKTRQESLAARQETRDAAAILFSLKFANDSR